MTYQRKAKPCPFGLIPEEDVCGKHPHCIAHKEPVSTCPERWRGKPREPLAELEQLRRRVEALEGVASKLHLACCPDHVGLTCPECFGDEIKECAACWTAALAQAETPKEKVIGRPITRDEALRISRQTIDDAEREREALAQAEGGE